VEVLLRLVIRNNPCVGPIEQFAQDQCLEELHSLLHRQRPVSKNQFAMLGHGRIGDCDSSLDLSLLVRHMVE
jgi:hypothetical protein